MVICGSPRRKMNYVNIVKTCETHVFNCYIIENLDSRCRKGYYNSILVSYSKTLVVSLYIYSIQ